MSHPVDKASKQSSSASRGVLTRQQSGQGSKAFESASSSQQAARNPQASQAARHLPVSQSDSVSQRGAQSSAAAQSGLIPQQPSKRPPASQSGSGSQQATRTPRTSQTGSKPQLSAQNLQASQTQRGSSQQQTAEVPQTSQRRSRPLQNAPSPQSPQTSSGPQQGVRNAQASHTQRDSKSQHAAESLEPSQSGSIAQQGARNPQGSESGSDQQRQAVSDPRHPATRRTQQPNSALNLRAQMDRLLEGERAAKGLPKSESDLAIQPQVTTRAKKHVVRFLFRTDLFLEPRDGQIIRADPGEVSALSQLINNYNKELPEEQAQRKMEMAWPRESLDPSPDKWWLMETNHTSSSSGRLVESECSVWSPITDPMANLFWRDDIEATFEYLERYFEVDSTGCFSHIGIYSNPEYSLTELKRVSQAALHFEETLDELIPRSADWEQHRGQTWGNWLGKARFAKHSRRTVFRQIEEVQCTRDLAMIVHGDVVNRPFWFNMLITPQPLEEGYLCWGRLPTLHKAGQIIEYITLAVAFVEAAFEFADQPPNELLKFSPDLEGLTRFLSGQGPVQNPAKAINHGPKAR